MTVDVVTFGCRLNIYESEAIKLRAAEAQLRDAVVFNTCAVTSEAVRQSRQAIRRVARQRPGARIIVTGCAAQVEPETYAAMPEVDRVLGNQEKLKSESYAGLVAHSNIAHSNIAHSNIAHSNIAHSNIERVRVNDIMSVRQTALQMVDAFDGHTRAFLQVQNGCDHRCTFCIIPYGRGPSRSVGIGEVVAEARRLAEKGYAEIVLTGVDLTSYGADLPGKPGLGALVKKILTLVPELKRLRLSSLDPVAADPILMAMIAEEERLMPHFHLSAQSGDDLILKRMKRRHTRGDVIAFCGRVRRLRPEAAFGADLIAGFPTESDAMFENTLSLVDDAGLAFLHVFPFSPRARTPAARMPQLKSGLGPERAARLRTKGETAQAARLSSLLGQAHDVLVERNGTGHTPCYAPVRLDGQADKIIPGSILRTRLIAVEAGFLTGVAA